MINGYSRTTREFHNEVHDILENEVNQGRYGQFKKKLSQHNIQVLIFEFCDSCSNIIAKNVNCLKNTTVSALRLNVCNVSNIIELCSNLKDIEISKLQAIMPDYGNHVDVSSSVIYLNAKEKQALVTALSESNLKEIDLIEFSDENEDELSIQEVINRNIYRFEQTPYTTACLNHLPKSEKYKYCSEPTLSKSSTRDDEILYAGGIFSNIPDELQQKVLSYMPYVNLEKAKILKEKAKRWHENDLVIEEEMVERFAHHHCVIF